MQLITVIQLSLLCKICFEGKIFISEAPFIVAVLPLNDIEIFKLILFLSHPNFLDFMVFHELFHPILSNTYKF